MENPPLAYPIALGPDDIARLLPHRGEMLFLRRLIVLAHDRYEGVVRWEPDSAMMRGHFPGMPLVPGVMLVEAVAQLAGAGMLAGDPTVQRMEGDRIGVLAGIRKCSFRRPVLPAEDVQVAVDCRQMSEFAVTATGVVRVGEALAANIEILLINSPRSLIERRLSTVIAPSA
jgi:3-hydroxyacyl-[acyl-carrier-protein] dehydratase